jgi:hypothetical protein
MLMNLYQLWLAQNDAREKENIEDPRSIARRMIANIEEWNSIHARRQPRAATARDGTKLMLTVPFLQLQTMEVVVSSYKITMEALQLEPAIFSLLSLKQKARNCWHAGVLLIWLKRCRSKANAGIGFNWSRWEAIKGGAGWISVWTACRRN